MKETKPLIETNPYLKDPKKRKNMFYINALSSFAIEGKYIRITRDVKHDKEAHARW